MKRYLPVELPDTTVTVDFLQEGVSVTLMIDHGRLFVGARMSHGETASTWDEHEVMWPLPERIKEPEVDHEWRPARKQGGAAGTGLRGEFEASFIVLLGLLGEPQYMPNAPNGGDGKVSTEWIVENKKGEICTIYDYKETSLYSEGMMSPEDFRGLPSYCWHIGAHSKGAADELIAWLHSQLDGDLL
jgi:hypothetical protein